MTDKREKRCIDCKRVKPLSEYYRNHTGRDGRRTRCKSCYSVLDRKRRIARESNGTGRGGIRGGKSPLWRKALNATCEFEPGPPDRPKSYEGRTIRETLKFGYLPPGSIWEVAGTRLVVWGVLGEPQYTTELKGR
jgi:hypothetical protein